MGKITAIAFTGAYRDSITCTYPLGNGYRSYLPSLMRFNAPDDWSPFGAGGINPYAYCGADPVNRSDPSGHVSFGNMIRRIFGLDGEVTEAAGSIAGQNAIRAGSESGLNYAGSWRLRRRRESDPTPWELEFKNPPNLTGSARSFYGKNPWFKQLEQDGAMFIHGSNSWSLQGVVRHGGVLSREDIEASRWFDQFKTKIDGTNVLPAGENRATIDGLSDLAYVSTGVSVMHIHNINGSLLLYAKESGEFYPVIYAFDRKIRIRLALDLNYLDHNVTRGSVGIEHIVGIYVPPGLGDRARNDLRGFGAEALSERVRESDIFSYWAYE